MNRIDARFQRLKSRNETAFIPFITAGDPTLARTREIVLALEKAGADIVELGVPFSDPIADGVVNQEAAQRALKHHVTLHDCVALVKGLRKDTQLPLLLFTYYNPVLAYGVEQFAADCADAGVDGVLCVDLPPEEDPDYNRFLHEKDIATVYLVAPTTRPERMDVIARYSRGFIYYVSSMGVTGERRELDDTVGGMVAELKSHADTPVAVGFGIATPDQAAQVAGYADGVVVGSAIVRMIGSLGDSPATAERVGAFVKTLVDACKTGTVS